MPDWTYIQETLAVSRSLLTGIISLKTVEKAVQRNQITPLARGWYAWNSLPDRWREQVSARLGYDPATRTQADHAAAQVLAMLEPVKPADRAALEAYRIANEVVDTTTGEVISLRGSGLPRRKLDSYLEQCRWLDLLSRLDKRTLGRMGLGRTRRKAIEDTYIPLIQRHDVDLPTTYQRLLIKEKAYLKEGATCVISGKLGMKNRQKVSDEQLAFIVALAGDARKPTDLQVWQWFNERAMAKGWPRVSSVRTIQRHMHRHDIAPLIVMARDGYDAWKRQYCYQISTIRPSARSLMWVSDGTKVNYYYRLPGKKTRRARLMVYSVMDVYSECFLGVAIGTEENHLMVRDALRRAIETAGELPYQMLYDGDSANKKFFQSGWPALHFAAMPYNGQSKAIESAFNRLQNQVMRDRPFFTGQNITARSQRSRANLDLIDEMERRGELPTEAEAIAAAYEDFQIWNHTPRRHLGGLTPMEAWEASVCPAPRSLTAAAHRDLFWEWNTDRGYLRAITYTASGLLMRHNGQDYRYEVQDLQGAPDLSFHTRYIGQRFHVKYDPQRPGDGVALYQHPADKDYLADAADLRHVADAVAKTAIERAIYDHQDATRAHLAARLDLKRAQATDARDAYDRAREAALDPDEIAASGHRLSWVSKTEVAQAEAQTLETPPQAETKGPNLTDKKYDRYKNQTFFPE